MIKLFGMLKPFRLQVAAVLLLVFCQSLSDLYLPTLLSDIVNQGILTGNVSYIMRIGGFMLLVSAGGCGLYCDGQLFVGEDSLRIWQVGQSPLVLPCRLLLAGGVRSPRHRIHDQPNDQ